MKKRFFALVAALIVASLIGSGIAESRTIRISRKDVEFTTNDLSVTEGDTAAEQTKAPPSSSDSEEESGTRYILNQNSKKIHYPDCSGVARMKESNKLAWIGTVEELLEKGYTPCGTCKPQ